MSDDTKLSVTENWVFETCCMMEETCAAIYRYFAELYAHNAVVSRVWTTTAQEEDGHAEQFRLAYRLHGAGVESLNIDDRKAKSLLAKMQAVYKQVQETPPSLKESFRFAIHMEYALAEYHMDSIAHFKDEGLKKLFVSMRNCDKQHIERLETAFAELVD